MASPLGHAAVGDRLPVPARLLESTGQSLAELVRHRHPPDVLGLFLQSGRWVHPDGDLRWPVRTDAVGRVSAGPSFLRRLSSCQSLTISSPISSTATCSACRALSPSSSSTVASAS